MSIDRVVIDPGHGADGVGFDFGNSMGVLCEWDILLSLAEELLEHLELSRVRTEILPVRKRPGIPIADRHLHVPAGCLLLSLNLGWQAKTKRNCSALTSQLDPSHPLIAELETAVSRWGIVTHGDHAKTQLLTSSEPLLTLPDSTAIRIEPFALNGPNSLLYAARIPALGKAIAQRVTEYVSLHHSRALIPLATAAIR
jgi:hypothetical protein